LKCSNSFKNKLKKHSITKNPSDLSLFELIVPEYDFVRSNFSTNEPLTSQKMRKFFSTGQTFICIEVTSYKIHILVISFKNFANTRLSALNFKSFSRLPDFFFITVGQNNFGNKIPLLAFFHKFLSFLKLHKLWQFLLIFYDYLQKWLTTSITKPCCVAR
jgi:hypothetical protein